jgi:general secretion pathway protein I
MNQRRGLSLLEVILAIAILGGALATIGQLIRIGSRNAAAARDLTLAQIHCESTLNEVAAGAIPLAAASDVPLDEYGEWLYTVESAPIDDGGLIELRVTVHQSPDAAARPVSYTLTRWMIDPAVEEAAAAEAAAMKEQAAAAAAQGEENAAAGAGEPDPNADGQQGGGNLPGGTGGQGQPGAGGPGSGLGGPGIPGAPGGFGAGRPDGPGGQSRPGAGGAGGAGGKRGR